MKVLFLSQIVPYPAHGGVLQRGFNVIRQLGRRARVHLLAFVHPDVLPSPTTLEESRRMLGQYCERIDYFPLWPKTSRLHQAAAVITSLASPEPFSAIAHRSRAFQRRVDEALADTEFDIVHVDTIGLSRFVRFGRANLPPTVLTHHNVESELMGRRAEFERRAAARWFLRREAAKLAAYEGAQSTRYDLNIVMSARDGALLARRVPGLRTAVVPNGVDTDYFAPSAGPTEPALVYTGGMNMFANRDAVMSFVTDIWPRLAAARSDLRFYAVGQDPPRELAVLAERDPRIVVTGYVDDIRPIVGRSAVYVVPLRVGGGTRLKVLDAMAMGKAIVSTRIGCEGIDVTSGEHLVLEDTAEAFASATLALLDDASRRDELGRRARAHVKQHYAWGAIGDRLIEAYELALAARRPGRSAVLA